MSLLPPNASALEQALEQAVQLPALPVPLRALWNPATCPVDLLPWLAWALSVDDWDATWPEAVKRSVIATAIAVQRRKGVIGAVRQAVASFGGAISLKEWFEYSPAGDRGTFDLVLALTGLDGAPSAEFVDAVIRAIERTKPLSRHFTFTLALDLAAQIGLICVARPTVYARLDCAA
jgi:phage tail P2-like protein